MAHMSQSQVWDHLGLVAAMYEALGIGAVIDHAMAQDATQRTVSLGQAVNAMVLNGLGVVNQQLALVPSFFHNKPTARLMGPGLDAAHLNDDVRGRALAALYGAGVTPLYRLSAAHAAQRVGLTVQFAHLDTTSFQVDGRYNRAEAPEDQSIHISPGDSRDQRPDLNQVLRELIVEQRAGIPLLLKPLSGQTNDQVEFGRIITEHVQQLGAAPPLTYLVADSALSTAENLGHWAQSGLQWMTRGPATLAEVHAALVRVMPEPMTPLADGDRSHEAVSTDGGSSQRWMVVYSEARQQRSRRAVETQRRTPSDAELQAFKHLRRTTFACAADAQQALQAFTQALHATRLEGGRIRLVTRDGKRGRPPAETSPRQVEDVIEGALASSRAYRRVL